jgi:uncharacterized protein
VTNQQEEVLAEYLELVRFLVGSLLGEEADFEVKGEFGRDQLQIELHVPEAQRGRVIGRGGRIARALRTLVGGAALANHQPVVLDIVD